MFTRMILPMIFAVVLAPGAMAQVPCLCNKDCAGRPAPEAGLKFDDELHRDWYVVRFWTGECAKGLPFCWAGAGWWDLMETVLPRIQEPGKAVACKRLFDLGTRIGYEWGKDNDIRLIHSREFRGWSRKLRKADDPLPVIDEIEAAVAERLADQ